MCIRDRFNGNAFAKLALDSGCAFAIIDEIQYAVEDDQRYILVDDCLQTMQPVSYTHLFLNHTRIPFFGTRQIAETGHIFHFAQVNYQLMRIRNIVHCLSLIHI